MSGESERSVESKAVKAAAKRGWWSFKPDPRSVTGMPDRGFLVDGVIKFIEFKAPGKKPREKQWVMIARLRRDGFIAEYADNVETAIKILEGSISIPEADDRSHPSTRQVCAVGGHGSGEDGLNPDSHADNAGYVSHAAGAGGGSPPRGGHSVDFGEGQVGAHQPPHDQDSGAGGLAGTGTEGAP